MSDTLTEAGLSANAAALAMAIPANRLTAIMNKRRSVTAETAMRLSGKSDEEARRIGAVDKADEQVESMFEQRYRTSHSPVHRAVWEKVPLDRNPESQTSAPVAVSLVEVWNAWKLQRTASPGETVTVEGEKAIPGPTWTD